MEKKENITQTATLWYQTLFGQLKESLGRSRETEALTKRLLEAFFEYTSTDYLLDRPLTITHERHQELLDAVQQLAAHKPLQYVLGYVDFADCRLSVNSDVLIPRPETEQMSKMIIATLPPPSPAVLDIGTGSGCIAIAIAKACPSAEVTALDISSQALDVARQNAQNNGVTVQWLHLDILQEELPPKRWDMIVSNPPYIPVAEKEVMQKRVTAYEPHQALFIPNEDPLLFYRRLSQIAPNHLTRHGRISIEVHEDFAHEAAQLYEKDGWLAVQIIRDLNAKLRWITAYSPHLF